MVTREQWREARDRAWAMLQEAGIVLTPEELDNMQVADFGLGKVETIGLEMVTYVNTEKVCAKEIVMFPGQLCPEHRHPSIDGQPGKEETFRCRWGEVRLYVPGPASEQSLAVVPVGREQHLTVKNQIVLRPGEQYTLYPNTLHWFQAGPSGAIVSEFSTRSTDENDIFTDPEVRR